MTATQGRQHKGGRLEDARGLIMTQYDPVKSFLLNRYDEIPEDTLQAIANELLPGARRKRIFQFSAMIFGFAFVFGGNFIYFRYMSTWKGFDPVLMTIYSLQIIALSAGPYLAFRMARKEYNSRILATMLKYQRCPHCAYDIHGLPVDTSDGSTRCPECGYHWILPSDT